MQEIGFKPTLRLPGDERNIAGRAPQLSLLGGGAGAKPA